MKATITLRTFLFAAAILFGITTSIVAADGQTKKSRTTPARNRKNKSTKPKAVANVPAKVTSPSGLVYVITRPSNGRQPQVGETVVVHYTGLLGSGAKFDSSLDRGQPLTFKLGVGRVIKGWDEGIAKLRVGEQATLFIPPHLGYGPTGHPPEIPPNSTLIFIVELIEIREDAASK